MSIQQKRYSTAVADIRKSGNIALSFHLSLYFGYNYGIVVGNPSTKRIIGPSVPKHLVVVCFCFF